VLSQKEYGDFETYSKYDFDYIKDGEQNTYRTRNKGNWAVGLYYFFPIDYSKLNNDIIADSNTIIDIKHRVAERFIPNWKYYINDKSNLVFGVYTKRTNIRYKGEIDTTLSNTNLLDENIINRKNGFYGRIGYERHFAQPSYRYFDLDFFAGSALSFGFAPEIDLEEKKFSNGDYLNSSSRRNVIGLGLDLYSGVNFQFQNFSIGVELIALGFDSNRGIGRTKVVEEQSINGTVTSNEYYTQTDSNYSYSKLKLTRNLASMYRGIRFSVSYYF
jgi:hypothetical protein